MIKNMFCSSIQYFIFRSVIIFSQSRSVC